MDRSRRGRQGMCGLTATLVALLCVAVANGETRVSGPTDDSAATELVRKALQSQSEGNSQQRSQLLQEALEVSPDFRRPIGTRGMCRWMANGSTSGRPNNRPPRARAWPLTGSCGRKSAAIRDAN